jgi:hypothetical protein
MCGNVFQHRSWKENSQTLHSQKLGKRCEDYVLIAQDVKADGSMNERKITLFDLAGTLAT